MNPHLRGTLETLNLLLGKDMSCGGREDFRRMALVNSAKCSRKGTADQAPERVFDKCARYLLPELKILKPGILVVQGKLAWKALRTTLGREKLKKVDRHALEGLARALTGWACVLDYDDGEKVVWKAEIGTSPVVVVKTIHPSARGKHRKKWTCFRDEILSTLSRIVVAFATEKTPS